MSEQVDYDEHVALAAELVAVKTELERLRGALEQIVERAPKVDRGGHWAAGYASGVLTTSRIVWPRRDEPV